MSAATIDAAMAAAVETLFGAGTYRQQSDVRQDRERVDASNVAYQLVVEQLTEDPELNAAAPYREFAIVLVVKKYVADRAAERAWRLGGMAAGREALLSRDFYYALGEQLVVDAGNPRVTDPSEIVGNVMRFTMQVEVRQRA